jgi:ABC-2 type transport system permease protein
MTGTWQLVRLILRRDRVIAPLWVVILAVLPLTYLSTMTELFPDDASRHAYYLGVRSNPAELGLLGPVFGGSSGALAMWRSGFVLLLVGLASLLTVIRHTRTEEDLGRRELIGAGVVGRASPLIAAMIFTAVAEVVLGLIIFAGEASQGLPLGSSFAMGLAFTAVGWAFAGVGALAAQLSEGARTARGIALSVLGAAFLLRVAGDSAGAGKGESTFLSWLSPIGWSQQARPFAGERWWVFALPIGLSIVLTMTALQICLRRDLGAGVISTRPGPAEASARLSGPFGLAWRQHWGSLVGWAVAFGAVGVVVGGASKSIAEELGTSQAIQDLLRNLGGTDAVVDAYLASTVSVLGLLAASYTISAVLRMRGEEEAQRTEAVLATAVSRLRYSSSHVAFAVLGPVVILAIGGGLTGLVYGAATGNVGGETPRLLLAGLLQLPAVWVLTGLALALFGLLPRLMAAAWVALGAVVLISFLGPALQWDQWSLNLSPFTHIPKYPGQAIVGLPLAVLTVVAALLASAGLTGFRRRDIG